MLKQQFKLLLAGVLITSFAGISSLVKAEAILISSEEHWNFIINRWDWDSTKYRNFGVIDPTITILNETADSIYGYVGDSNGTRLFMYNDEQVVQVRYVYDSGLITDWSVGARFDKGYFTIIIPEKYREANLVDVYVGNNQYTVKDGTWTTHQTMIQINSARLKYQMDPLLDEPVVPETTIAAVEPNTVADPCLSSSSLIDRILCMHSAKVQIQGPSLIAVALSKGLVQQAV